jgi:hypothetical protein
MAEDPDSPTCDDRYDNTIELRAVRLGYMSLMLTMRGMSVS